MEHPLISVILPIYNIEKYLPICMESLMRQTYKNLEIIMVDDGSKDSCSILCDEFGEKDKRIKVYHKKNGGLSEARNYGIEHSNGEYITCVDPDDYVDIDYIEYLYMILKKYQTRMSICQQRIHYNNGSLKRKGTYGDEALPAIKCLERMMYHDIIDTSACAKLYHRDLFQTVRYPVGKLFEDIGTTYALMMQCDEIAVGYEEKYNYVFHNNSIVNSSFRPSKLDLLTMTDKMASDVCRKYPKLKRAVLRRRVYARFSTLNQMLNVDGYSEIKSEIIDFIKLYRKEILHNSYAPKRDKIAIIVLSIDYRLYKFCWLRYQRHIMGKNGTE